MSLSVLLVFRVAAPESSAKDDETSHLAIQCTRFSSADRDAVCVRTTYSGQIDGQSFV